MRKVGFVLSVFLLGVFLQWAGFRANIKVITDNEGQMPVWVLTKGMVMSILVDPSHTFLTAQSKDKPLCDIIPIPTLEPDWTVSFSVFSIGDLTAITGLMLTLTAPLLPFIWLARWLVRRVRR